MSRIEREKQTVRKMIELYCRHRLKQVNIPEEYQHLAEFACRRLDHCKYGEKKTACKNCPTHCYAPKEREQIRRICHIYRDYRDAQKESATPDFSGSCAQSIHIQIFLFTPQLQPGRRRDVRWARGMENS